MHMLYEKYEHKIKKRIKLKQSILKHKILILVICAVLALLLIVYASLKGNITKAQFNEKIEYGDLFNIQSEAMLSHTTYRYRQKGTQTWQDEVPVRIGTYEVQVSSNRIFGIKQHQIYTFTIVPKAFSVSVKEAEIEFGKTPSLSLSLLNGDSISNVDFDYEDITKAQTVVTPKNITIVDKNGTDVTETYDISYESTPIKFIKGSLVVSLKPYEAVYDGKSHQSELFTLNKELSKDLKVVIKSLGSSIDVGTTTNIIEDVKVFYQDIDVTHQFNLNKKNSSIRVVKNTLTVKPTNQKFTYQGVLQTTSQMDMIKGQLPEDHLMEATSNAFINAGSYQNEIKTLVIKDKHGKDVTNFFDIKYEKGQIVIDKIKLDVKTQHQSLTYIGQRQIYEETMMPDDLIKGHQLKITIGITHAGNTIDDIDYEVTDDKGLSFKHNYDVNLISKNIMVIPQPLTIKPKDVFKIYDGTALKSDTYEVISNTLLMDHKLEITTNGSQTHYQVAPTSNQITSHRILDSNDNDVSRNYEVSYQEGYLSIEKRIIEIKPKDVSKIYDGTALASNEVEIISDFKLVLNHLLTIQTQGSQTNYQEVSNPNDIQSHEIKTSDGVDVKENYAVTYFTGRITIDKRPIMIKPKDVSKIYDGEVLISNEIEIISENQLISGHQIIGQIMGQQTDYQEVNEQSYVIEHRIENENGLDFNFNYDVGYEVGHITILKRPIDIKPKDVSKIYDGKILSSNEVEITSEFKLVLDHSITILTNGLIQNVGEIKQQIIKVDITTSNGEDVSFNYDISLHEGSLKITPKEITIVSESKVFTYNGMFQQHDVLDFDHLALIENEHIQINLVPMIQNIGEIKNDIGFDIVDAFGQSVYNNYDITYEVGTLTVLKRKITIKPIDVDEIYNGFNITATTGEIVEELDGALNFNRRIEIKSLKSLMFVGKILDNTVDSFKIYHEDSVVTDNYEVAFSVGSITVRQKPIHLMPLELVYYYDGEAASTTSFGFLDDTSIALTDFISVKTFGSRINVGVSKNEIVEVKIRRTETSEDVKANYDITLSEGVIRVLPRPITIKPKDVSKVYDGEALISNEVEVTSYSKLVLDHQLTVQIEGSQTEYQDINNQSQIRMHQIKTLDGMDVTYNYAVTYLPGSITIYKRPITIKPKDASKIYDGEALISNEVEITSELKLVLDHILSITTSGILTDVGHIDNHIQTFEIKSGSIDVAFNYEVTVIKGTLSILHKKLNIESESQTYIYNGTLQKHEILNYDTTELVSGQVIKMQGGPGLNDVGEIKNDIVFDIVDISGHSVRKNYEVTYNIGTLTVVKRKITVKPKDVDEVYSGFAITSRIGEIVEELGGTLEIERMIWIDSTEYLINVGQTSDNKIATVKYIYHGNSEVSKNYDVSVAKGSIRVTPKSVNIKLIAAEKDFDGMPLTSSEAKVEGIASNDRVVVVTNGSQTIIGTSDNLIISYMFYNQKDEVVNDNYHVVGYTHSTLTINERKIMIKPTDIKVIYDGTVISANDFEITGNVAKGHKISNVSYDGHFMNAGEYESLITGYMITDQSGQDVSNFYQIETEKGSIHILQDTIKVMIADIHKVYDGTVISYKNDGSEYYVLNQKAGYHYDLKIGGSIIFDRGLAYIDNVNSEVTNQNGEIVTQNYQFEGYGEIYVSQRVLTITSGSFEREFDGTALKNDTYTIEGLGLASTDEIFVTIEGSITGVGEVENRITHIRIKDSDGYDITHYYDITKVFGKLIITES